MRTVSLHGAGVAAAMADGAGGAAVTAMTAGAAGAGDITVTTAAATTGCSDSAFNMHSWL